MARPRGHFFFSHAGPHKRGPGIAASRIATVYLFIAALLALIVAPALAHGVGVSVAAEVAVGFGLVQTEEPDTSSMDGIGEAIFNFSGEKGPFSGQIEITVAEAADAIDTAEHELVWQAAENLSVAISGNGFGLASSPGYISVVNAPGGPVGDEEAFIDFADTGMVNVEYALGKLTFGVALLDACVPDCGFTTATMATEDTEVGDSVLADAELQTTVVHLRREAEALSYSLYFANSSGTFSGSQADGAGSAVGAGLLFSGGDFTVGLDYSGATSECATDATEGACADDVETTLWGVAATFAGLGAHYYSGEAETGTETGETTNMDVVYLFEVGDATVGPEYRTTAVEADGSKTTASFLLFGMSMEF